MKTTIAAVVLAAGSAAAQNLTFTGDTVDLTIFAVNSGVLESVTQSVSIGGGPVFADNPWDSGTAELQFEINEIDLGAFLAFDFS
ncbi:MAG: hypothetical protein AAF747_07925, partial [Planctomycetota bacterium]